jgi:hypothetical protein
MKAGVNRSLQTFLKQIPFVFLQIPLDLREELKCATKEREREEHFQTAALQILKLLMKPKISVFFWGGCWWNFHIFFELKNIIYLITYC